MYEPLDLKIGKCRMMVAEPVALSAKDDPSQWTSIRIATKYPNITGRFFASKGVQVEMIKLYGSIELAPLIGLAERIVDLVEMGETLKQNGLVEVEEIMKITSRLIVNRASLRRPQRNRKGSSLFSRRPCDGNGSKGQCVSDTGRTCSRGTTDLQGIPLGRGDERREEKLLSCAKIKRVKA